MTITTLPFAPHDPAHVGGLAALFAAAECPCYCRYWHFSGDKNAWQERCFVDVGRNEEEMRAAAQQSSDEVAGVVAFAGDTLIGWCKVAPSPAMRKFYEQRYYRGLTVLRGRPTEGVLVLGCMLVHPAHRHQRVAHALAVEAVRYARDRGASVIEAFPRRTPGVVSDEEHWMGPENALLAAGFEAVEATPPYPVYRLGLRG